MKTKTLFFLSVAIISVFFNLGCKNLIKQSSTQPWKPLADVPSENFVDEIVVNTYGDIFLATWGDGIYRSADNGQSWKHLDIGTKHHQVDAIAINSQGDIFAGLAAPGDNFEGLFFSRKNSETWINKGFQSHGISAILINSKDQIFVGLGFSFLKSGAIFRSDNGGETWQELDPGFVGSDKRILSLACYQDSVVYASRRLEGGLLKSTDYGNSWSNTMNDSIFIQAIVINSLGHIFGGSYGLGVFRSVNEGKTWTLLTKGLPETGLCYLARDSKDNLFIGFENAGVFNSDDNGETWHEINTDWSHTNITAMTVDFNDRLLTAILGPQIYSLVKFP